MNSVAIYFLSVWRIDFLLCTFVRSSCILWDIPCFLGSAFARRAIVNDARAHISQ